MEINLRQVNLSAEVEDEEELLEGEDGVGRLLDDVAVGLDMYSGADITNLCRDAAMMSMRKAIGGKPLEELKRLRKEEIDKPITRADFGAAAARCKRTSSGAQIVRYEEWMDKHGSF